MNLQAFVVETATGETRQRLAAALPESFAIELPPGEEIVMYAGPEDIETLETWLDGSTLATRPRTVDADLQLAIAKAEMSEAVRRRRDKAEFAGCLTPAGRVETDPDSQRKVNGSVTMALIAATAGQPFSIEWTFADNSVVSLDGPAMITAGVMVGQHVSACHARALELKAAIAAAEDMAALAAIDIEEDWP